jgi:hypothetical protein
MILKIPELLPLYIKHLLNIYDNTPYSTYFCIMFLELWKINRKNCEIIINYIIKNKSNCWNMLLNILKTVDYNLNIEKFSKKYRQLYHNICTKIIKQFYEDWCNRETSDSKLPINFDYSKKYDEDYDEEYNEDYDEEYNEDYHPHPIYYNTETTWFFGWFICHEWTIGNGFKTMVNHEDYKNFTKIFLLKLENILKKNCDNVNDIFKKMLIDISNSKLDKILIKAKNNNINRTIVQKQETKKRIICFRSNDIVYKNTRQSISMLYYMWYVNRVKKNKPNKDISSLMFLDMDVIDKIISPNYFILISK